MRLLCAAILVIAVLTGCGPNVQQQLTGTWKIDTASSEWIGSNSTSTAERATVEGLMKQVVLTLKEDKSYELKFIMSPITGTWALDSSNKTLTLTPNPGQKSTIKFGGKDVMDLQIGDGVKSLVFTSTDPAKPGKLTFVKSP